MCEASVHTGEASLTGKSQTAINTFLHSAAYAAWHLCALFRWGWGVWVFITMNFLTSGTRHHCRALKELGLGQLPPSESGKEGQERTWDWEEDVTMQERGEVQLKVLQVRDRDEGWERKYLFMHTYSPDLLAVSHADHTAISQKDFMLWTPALGTGANRSLVRLTEPLKHSLILVRSSCSQASSLSCWDYSLSVLGRVQSILDINTFTANPCSYQHPSFALHEKQMTNIRTAKYFYSIFIACWHVQYAQTTSEGLHRECFLFIFDVRQNTLHCTKCWANGNVTEELQRQLEFLRWATETLWGQKSAHLIQMNCFSGQILLAYANWRIQT